MNAHLALRHPDLLPLLLLAAVPLLVHLISKRQAREVRFAAMEFVLRSQRRSARRLQLRQWVLLVARTLAFLAAVAAILGPSWTRDPVPGAVARVPTRHVLAVDVTASMQARVDGQQRLKGALAGARDLLKALPLEEPVAVVACGAAPVALLEPPSFDRAVAGSALAAIRPTLERGDLAACLARARAALGGGAEGPARITLFTDAARHAWPVGTAVPTGADGRALEVVVVRPDAVAPVNHALMLLEAVPAPEAGVRAVSLGFQVEAWGGDGPGELASTLSVDGVVVAQGTVSLAGPPPWARRFTHALPAGAAGAVHDVVVALPPDALELDNALSLPVRAPRVVQVLAVDGDPQTVAWRDELFYVERALAAPPPGGGRIILRVSTQAPTPAEVEAADVVMLCNVRSLPANTVQAIHALVRRGGGLFISGGEKVDVDFYNGSLAELLPQPLRGEKSRVELEDPAKREVLGLGQVEGAHPVFAPFDGHKPEGLTRARTHTVLLLETGGKAPRDVLARFSNGAPALLERQVGLGRVLLWTTTVDRDWSDLAIRPGFLPLLQQAVLYLADALGDDRPKVAHVGQPHAVGVRRGVQDVAVVMPSGQRVELHAGVGEVRVTVTGLSELGVHRVLMAPAGGELVEVPSERFSVWPDPAESDLTPLSDDELAARMPPGARYLGGGTPLGPPESPLWPYLLAALALLLLAEGWLARRG